MWETIVIGALLLFALVVFWLVFVAFLGVRGHE